MRIALIDNGSKLREQLESLLQDHEVTELSYPEADRARTEPFDAIVLSGSSLPQIVPVIEHPDRVQAEIQLIQESTVPLLGICYGAELIAFSFGAHLSELPLRQFGMRRIERRGEDALLEGLPSSFEAFEAHRWAIQELPKEFIPLAQSESGIEIYRHKTRPLYGVQFHPEKMTSEPAVQVFQNFLRLAQK